MYGCMCVFSVALAFVRSRICKQKIFLAIRFIPCKWKGRNFVLYANILYIVAKTGENYFSFDFLATNN